MNLENEMNSRVIESVVNGYISTHKEAFSQLSFEEFTLAVSLLYKAAPQIINKHQNGANESLIDTMRHDKEIGAKIGLEAHKSFNSEKFDDASNLVDQLTGRSR